MVQHEILGCLATWGECVKSHGHITGKITDKEEITLKGVSILRSFHFGYLVNPHTLIPHFGVSPKKDFVSFPGIIIRRYPPPANFTQRVYLCVLSVWP